MLRSLSSAPRPARASLRAAGGALAAAIFVALAASACGSTTVVKANPGCDDAKCAAGNKCLDGADGVKCRKTCTSNETPDGSCPYGYTCAKYPDVAETYCQKQTAELTKKDGQWGTPCNPSEGYDRNPKCDTDQSFACFARSPTDATAYCTRFSCTADIDCGPGFYCGDFNAQPNAVRPDRTVGSTLKACIRRTYCAPCELDLDCPTLAGKAQFCVTGQDGKGYCTSECAANQECLSDAQCLTGVQDRSGKTHSACTPRAGSCTGDGTICSPCRSDADCGQDGACVGTEYSTERFCAKRAPNNDCAQCVKDLPRPAVKVGCYTADPVRGNFVGDVPTGYCFGIYNFDSQTRLPGCWTPSRP